MNIHPDLQKRIDKDKPYAIFNSILEEAFL